jgi:hypothetical protein
MARQNWLFIVFREKTNGARFQEIIKLLQIIPYVKAKLTGIRTAQHASYIK